MRALLTGEDRLRFEQLIGEVEQGVWEMEDVTAELARVIAGGIGDTLPEPAAPVELTDAFTAALRSLDSLLASRAVGVDIDAPPAVFALANRDRLAHLFSVALAIAASAAAPRTQARIAYATDGEHVQVRIAPYRARDPRTVIVAALAHSQGAELQGDDFGLRLRLHAAGATVAS